MTDTNKIINNISPTDALSILKIIAANDERLAERIANIALEHLSIVDLHQIATTLYNDLTSLDVEEVWNRAGETGDDYVEPQEAAEDMIEEVLGPYLSQLTKYQKLGLHVEARRLCKGLLSGLYRFETEATTEFKTWAVEAPRVFAEMVVDIWRTANPSPPDVVAMFTFVEDHLGEWGKGLL